MKITDDNIVRIAKALSDKSRIRLLEEIARRKTITCRDAEKITGLSQPTISHHLKILYEAGLLKMEKNGRYMAISVNRETLNAFSIIIQESIKA